MVDQASIDAKLQLYGIERLNDSLICWVCAGPAEYVDWEFVAPICGALCSWAAWEAMRLHDTPFRAW